MPQRALITGVSGFAGGHLAELLLQQGDRVLGCSPNGSWEADSPHEIRDRMELVGWDLAEPQGLAPGAREHVQRFAPDVIYHLAAISVPERCGVDEPTPQATRVNVEGTRQVLELAGELEPSPLVVFVSSSHVYSPVSPSRPRVDETAPLGPQTAYGRTKLAGERLVHQAVKKGLRAIVVRAFHHGGPRQRPPMMLAQWARQFALGNREPVRVYTLDAWLDLCDVRDVVRAYRLLAERGTPGRVYNVGSGTNRRSGEIFDLLRRLADPWRPVVETRPGHRQEPIADTSLLVAATDWQPRIPLEQTVADTFQWWCLQTRRAPSPQGPAEGDSSGTVADAGTPPRGSCQPKEQSTDSAAEQNADYPDNDGEDRLGR